MEKRLYRSREQRMLAGVAGGIAEYFAIDPVIVRLIFVVLALADGIGVLIYLACWIIVPENPNQKETSESTQAKATEEKVKAAAEDIVKRTGDLKGNNLIGLLLIVLGIIFLMQSVFPFWLGISQLWPIFIIIFGIWVIVAKK